MNSDPILFHKSNVKYWTTYPSVGPSVTFAWTCQKSNGKLVILTLRFTQNCVFIKNLYLNYLTGNKTNIHILLLNLQSLKL